MVRITKLQSWPCHARVDAIICLGLRHKLGPPSPAINKKRLLARHTDQQIYDGFREKPTFYSIACSYVKPLARRIVYLKDFAAV